MYYIIPIVNVYYMFNVYVCYIYKGKEGCREKRVTFKNYFKCFHSVLKLL